MSNFWGAYQFTRTYGDEYDVLIFLKRLRSITTKSY